MKGDSKQQLLAKKLFLTFSEHNRCMSKFLQCSRKELGSKSGDESKEDILSLYEDKVTDKRKVEALKRRFHILYILQENGAISKEEIHKSIDCEELNIAPQTMRTTRADLKFLRDEDLVNMDDGVRPPKYSLKPEIQEEYQFYPLPKELYVIEKGRPLQVIDFKLHKEDEIVESARCSFFDHIISDAPKSFVTGLHEMFVILDEFDEEGGVTSKDWLHKEFPVWLRVLNENGFVEITLTQEHIEFEITRKGQNLYRWLEKIKEGLKEFTEKVED